MKESGLKDSLLSDWLRGVLPLLACMQHFPPLPVIQNIIPSTTAIASTTRTKQNAGSFRYQLLGRDGGARLQEIPSKDCK